MKKQIALTTALAARAPARRLRPIADSGSIIHARDPIHPVHSAGRLGAARAAGSARAAEAGREHIHEHDMGPKEPVTFLGVETSDVPRVLSEQMGLPKGFGVVIDYVVPNSPAAAAGLQQSDIIRMLNDQQIVNPSQLGKLVRSFADGTSVDFTIMRKGKEMKVNVKLAKKEVSAGRGAYGYQKEWNFDDLEKMKFDFQAPDMTAVREAVARAKDQAMRARDEAQRAVRGLRIVTSDDGLTKSTRIDLGRATITFSDDQGELKIENANGRKMLTAKDAQGKQLYNGPIETPEDRAKLPDNVRQRLEKLERQELPEAPEPPEAPEAPEAPAGAGDERIRPPAKRGDDERGLHA